MDLGFGEYEANTLKEEQSDILYKSLYNAVSMIGKMRRKVRESEGILIIQETTKCSDMCEAIVSTG